MTGVQTCALPILHLEYVIIDQEFERFLPALYNYSPRLYNKYLKKVDMPLNSILI